MPPVFHLKSAVPDNLPPVPAAYMVLAKTYGTGLAPGMHNTDLPNTGVKFPAYTPAVTISGLAPNEVYCFSVVAFDAEGVVINGQGAPTAAVATIHPLPSTALWSFLAVAASRLGCVAVARRATGTVHRRFVETTRDRETWAAHPMSAYRLRREVVSAASFPTLRAAARCLLVSAEVALATRRPDRPRGEPLVALSVPDIHEQIFRLKTAKKVLLAMELSSYNDDKPLLQESGLRLGNCLAPLLTVSRKPPALVTALAQCLLALHDAGPARAPAVAALAASLTFELAAVARHSGEAGAAAYASSLTLPALRQEDDAAARAPEKPGEDAASAPLIPPGREFVALEEYLLSQPQWREFNSEALNARAAAADDPCAAVIPKLPVEGAAAAYAALIAGGDAFAAHPAYLRAFARVAEAAVAQGATAELPGWAAATLDAFKTATRVSPIAMPDPPLELPTPEAEQAGELPAEEEARISALEAAAVGIDASEGDVAAAAEARDIAVAHAETRQAAAGVLTRRLPATFVRLKAVRASRALLAAGTTWHAAVHTVLGLTAHETQEAAGLPLPPPSPGLEDANAATAAAGAGGEDVPGDALTEDSDGTTNVPPAALAAMRSLTRAAELAARCGSHGRLANATRALHNLARCPVIGLGADPRLATNGGARCLYVAASRLLEHFERLRSGEVDESPLAAVEGGAAPAPITDAAMVELTEQTAKAHPKP